jgi:SPP1 family predicted phage head-tail adaptor
MISAAEFNQRITLQSKSVTRNSIGEEVVTWGDVATVWAKVMPLRGNAFYAANQQQHSIDARFLIRQRTGLTEDMRLQWKGEPYDITSIIKGTGPYTGTLELAAINGVRDGR